MIDWESQTDEIEKISTEEDEVPGNVENGKISKRSKMNMAKRKSNRRISIQIDKLKSNKANALLIR